MTTPQKPPKATTQVVRADYGPNQPPRPTGPQGTPERTTPKRADVRPLSARRAASLRTWRNRRKMLAKSQEQRERWMTEHADEHRIGPNHPRQP